MQSIQRQHRRDGTQLAMHCLCHTNLHMSVAMGAPPNRKMHSQLSQLQGCSAAGRSAALGPSALKYVSACAVSNTRSSWAVRRGCHQITQQLGFFAAQSSISLKDQRSHGRAVSLRFLRFTSYRCRPWFRRTFVVTFCVRALHADVFPELSQDARNQETTSKMAHLVFVSDRRTFT